MSSTPDYPSGLADERQPAYDGAVRPAEQIEGAHDTYDKGEVGSIGAIVSDIAADISTLMRQEVALAKAEVKQSAVEAGKGAGMFAGAGVAGHMTLLFLSIALWWGLGDWWDNHWLGALVVAILWGIIAGVMALMGKKSMENVDGVPRTVETAKAIPDALKGNEDPR